MESNVPMQIRKAFLCSSSFKISVGFFFLVLSNTALSGPGRLSDVPLYVGLGVKPNVLYVIDDSTSMSSTVLKSRGAEMTYPDWSGPLNTNNNQGDQFYFNEAYYELNLFNPITKLDGLELCRGYNVLFYNPNIHYTPWEGNDLSLIPAPFGDMPFDRARVDPRYPTPVVNLSDALIMPWNDSNGEFEAGACNEQVLDSEGEPVPPNALLPEGWVDEHLVKFDLAQMTWLNGQEELDYQKQNFANWYTYYRSRNSAMISALSKVLAESEQRVGIATINNNQYIGLPVADLELSNNRDRIVQKSVSLNPDRRIAGWQGTPLEQALHNAGKYFNNSEDPASGFLGSSTPSSPILSEESGGACQQNFSVLMTDGFSDANHSMSMSEVAQHYYETDLHTGRSDLVNSRNRLDTAEHQHMVTYAVAFGVAGNFDPEEVVSKSRDPAIVIRSGEVEQNFVNAADQQAFLENQDKMPSVPWWSAANIMDFDGNPANWPLSIEAKSPDTIDDLFHATVMGRGKFFNSSNASDLVRDLREIDNAIADDAQGTAASVGFNSTSIDSNTLLFQGWFDTSTWLGELRAFPYTDGSAPESSDDAVWEAGALLAARVDPENDTATPRQIITFTGGERGSGIPFVAPPGITNSDLSDTTLSAVQVADLMVLAPFQTPTSADERQDNLEYLNAIVAFLRGDVSVDGQPIHMVSGDETPVTNRKFRERYEKKVLGDIVHSAPVIVSEPAEPYPANIEPEASQTYLQFASANASRTPVLYVGANDGMLHAFQATTRGTESGSQRGGDELFAYIPSILFSDEVGKGLHHLASENYENNHRAYVDGSLTPADVYVDDAWRTYLVGALGAGGKGVFVLDITNPSNFSEDNAASIVKMEFTHPNLGYTFARPQIGKLNNGEWAAIFGNGYNNNGSHKASLFILYLDGHEGLNGERYREITTNVGSADDNCVDMDSECNGLSSPSILDITGDSIVDRAYAGDIQGNLWAFDLSSEDPDDWGIAHRGIGGAATPLFRACRSSIGAGGGSCPPGDRQPISVRPVVVSHPSQRSFTTDPNLLVFFGTGQYVAVGDTDEGVLSAESQSVYSVWDAGASNGNLQASDLVTQTITEGVDDFNQPNGTRLLTSSSVNYLLSTVGVQGVYGWKSVLPASKERLVVNPLSVGPFVIYTTTIPSNEACLGGGSGYLMIAGLVDGTQPRFRAFPGREPENISGFVLNAAPGGSQIIDNDIVIPDYQGEIHSEDFMAAQPRPSRRAAWSILK